MNRLEEVIQKGLALNAVIKRINDDTDFINKAIKEQRYAKQEDMLNNIKKYEGILCELGIDMIEFPVNTCMFYNGLTRSMGIRLRTWMYHGKLTTQIDLGVFSTVTSGFYAEHSIGTVTSGSTNEEILKGFIENWECIRNIIDETFANELEKILQKRTEEAIKDREIAIANLSAIK